MIHLHDYLTHLLNLDGFLIHSSDPALHANHDRQIETALTIDPICSIAVMGSAYPFRRGVTWSPSVPVEPTNTFARVYLKKPFSQQQQQILISTSSSHLVLSSYFLPAPWISIGWWDSHLWGAKSFESQLISIRRSTRASVQRVWSAFHLRELVTNLFPLEIRVKDGERTEYKKLKGEK